MQNHEKIRLRGIDDSGDHDFIENGLIYLTPLSDAEWSRVGGGESDLELERDSGPNWDCYISGLVDEILTVGVTKR
jgi:hypothetical protein